MRRFEELDALRGIAALAVVLSHLPAKWPHKDFGFIFGATGVDLFFIISGFVILLTLDGKKSGMDFVVSRLSRLYPAYWIAVCLTAGAICLKQSWDPETQPITLTRFFANLTMVQHYLGSADIDDVYWTLVIELSFYAGMLGLFLSKGIKHVEAIGFASLTFAPVFQSDWMKHVWPQAHDFLINWLPIVCFYPLFVAGICFYKLKTARANPWRYVLVALCYLAQLLLFSEGGICRFNMTLGEYAAFLSCYFALFLLFTHDKLGFLINRTTLFLGKISYSLYLCHQYLGMRFIMPYLIDKCGVEFWAAACISLLTVLAIATLVNRYIEIPSINHFRNWYRRA